MSAVGNTSNDIGYDNSDGTSTNTRWGSGNDRAHPITAITASGFFYKYECEQSSEGWGGCE